MEALARPSLAEARRSPRRSGRCFIPALPTLWPSMLWAKPQRDGALPFASAQAHYFYFARNAIWLAVKVLGLSGHEILVPAYHHGVEVEALIDAGARVRFFRVDERMRPDLDDIARKITAATRAVYLIHYLGFPGPLAQVRALADSRGLLLIEDCALALFSKDCQAPLGSQGDASIFCFYKTLPVPNGGALVLADGHPTGVPEPLPAPWFSTARHLGSALLSNLELRGGTAARILSSRIRALGRKAGRTLRNDHVATGTQHFERERSGLGISKVALRMARSQDAARIVAARRRNYFLLLARLRQRVPPIFSALPAGVCPLFYPLGVGNKAAFAQKLWSRGVETVDFWRWGHSLCAEEEFPEVAKLRRTILEIPIHQDVTPRACAALADVIEEALDEVGP